MIETKIQYYTDTFSWCCSPLPSRLWALWSSAYSDQLHQICLLIYKIKNVSDTYISCKQRCWIKKINPDLKTAEERLTREKKDIFFFS